MQQSKKVRYIIVLFLLGALWHWWGGTSVLEPSESR